MFEAADANQAPSLACAFAGSLVNAALFELQAHHNARACGEHFDRLKFVPIELRAHDVCAWAAWNVSRPDGVDLCWASAYSLNMPGRANPDPERPGYPLPRAADEGVTRATPSLHRLRPRFLVGRSSADPNPTTCQYPQYGQWTAEAPFATPAAIVWASAAVAMGARVVLHRTPLMAERVGDDRVLQSVPRPGLRPLSIATDVGARR